MTADSVQLRRAGTWLALANVAGVIVWLGVFMNWVQPTYGRFQAELIGGSTFAWPFLVLLASAIVLFGAERIRVRWLGWAVVALLVALLADQTLGALRDGQVLAPGLRLGLLMAAEAVMAAAALVLAWWR
jgi:hypothetical protein